MTETPQQDAGSMEQTATQDEKPSVVSLPESEHDVLVQLNRLVPQFVVKVDKFSGSRAQLKAAIAAIILTPLAQIPSLSYPEQKELFEMAMEIQSLKLVLLYLGLRKQEKEHGKSQE